MCIRDSSRGMHLSLKPSPLANGRQPLVSTTAWRYSFYTPEMNLLSETELRTTPGTPQVLYEYIWFNGHPVAQVDAGIVTHWTFTDHLGTPIIQTTSAGNVYWQAEYEPYGKVFALRTVDQHQPLRLPGQEAEQLNLGPNGTTERSYNIFRWYRNGWGRYTQPEPIHPVLPEMPNVGFGYANGNPLSETDPLGLFVIDRGFPKSCQTTLNQAIDIVRSTLANKPGCNRCTAIGPSLQELFESPNLVIGFVESSSQGPCTYGETPWYINGQGQWTAVPNPRITGFACRMGRWMVARAIIHEMTHAGGASFEGPAYGAERRCGFPSLNPAQYGCPPTGGR